MDWKVLDLSLTLSISFSDYLPTYLGTRLTGGREDFSTPAMLSICFSADFQWSEHSSPFWKLIACARVRCKRIVDSVAANPREYLVRRAAKNVISPPPKTPPKKQQCKNQECLASYKKKLIACARVRCKRRVDSVAASPREYLVRRAAKNVISPPPTPPPETTMQKLRVSCKLQEELDSVCQGTVQEKSG